MTTFHNHMSPGLVGSLTLKVKRMQEELMLTGYDGYMHPLCLFI